MSRRWDCHGDWAFIAVVAAQLLLASLGLWKLLELLIHACRHLRVVVQ